MSALRFSIPSLSRIPQAVGVFTQSRMVIPDLIPGTTYTLQARAIGGSTGYSDWSDPVSHMSM